MKISHLGDIIKVSDKDIVIEIRTENGCDTCPISFCCTAKSDAIVTIKNNEGQYKKGDEIEVLIDDNVEKLGILLSYVLPSALIFASLVIASVCGVSDTAAAWLSLVCVAVYYAVLLFCRKTIGRICKIELKKR